ncbi:molecular chaperone DnaJ [Herbaspirillum sp. DW155]|uniref:J domain-containing protein n=1 Tax=Herbaspirillum sp. DW155 TaxID=3095609 RepID=UPI00308A1E12|nr:molecular chaperone DnaJ [Herbaspirillum sp. DW155]
MKKSTEQAVTISDSQQSAPLSPAQRRFNDLIAKIKTRRARLLEWDKSSSDFHKKYAEQFIPLDQELRELHIQSIHRLHEAWSQKGLTKGERVTLSEIIADMAFATLRHTDDIELKLIYNQHSGSDYDGEARADLDDMKQAMEEALDMDLGDELDGASPEEMMEKLQAVLDEKERQYLAAEQAREEARRASRKKSARQQAAETKKEAERTELSKSIREVYRKLASALHPDREPDASERERKTMLMQQVNQAYEKNDLLRLLELQLELEHIDQHALNGIHEERLVHYNQILKEQLGELDQEIRHVEMHFKQSFGLSPHARVNPAMIVRNLNKDLTVMREERQHVRSQLADFGDVQHIKLWLKHAKRQRARLWDEDGLY